MIKRRKTIDAQISDLMRSIGNAPATLELDQEIRTTGEKIRRKIIDIDIFVELTAEFRTEAALKDGIALEDIVTDRPDQGAYPYITHSIDYSKCHNTGVISFAKALLDACKDIRGLDLNGLTYSEYIAQECERTREEVKRAIESRSAEG